MNSAESGSHRAMLLVPQHCFRDLTFGRKVEHRAQANSSSEWRPIISSGIVKERCYEI